MPEFDDKWGGTNKELDMLKNIYTAIRDGIQKDDQLINQLAATATTW
jgi:hypothetical protein